MKTGMERRHFLRGALAAAGSATALQALQVSVFSHSTIAPTRRLAMAATAPSHLLPTHAMEP